LSGANLFVFAVLPWLVFNGWTSLRRSSLAVLLSAALLANLVVGGLRQLVAGAGLDEGNEALWGLLTLGLVWMVQLLPATSAPAILRGALRGLVHNMWRLQVAYMLGLTAFSFLMLSVLAPLFARSSPIMQVVIRVVLYTVVLEVVIAIVRVCSRANFSSHLPRDNLVVLLAPIVISAGLLGRILSSSMDSVAETIGVAIAISVTEVTLRMTLPSRDRVLLQCCWRICPCVFPSSKDRQVEQREKAAAHSLPPASVSDGAPQTFVLPTSATSSPSIIMDVSPPACKQASAEALPELAPRSAEAPLAESVLLNLATPINHGSAQHPAAPDLAIRGEARGSSTEAGPVAQRNLGNDPQTAAVLARAAREAQDIHAYFSLLTLDTMSEDIGILLSLPFALIMRLPPRVGGQPLGALDVLARVGGQYVLELLTDMAPALLMLCVNVCCGVRWRRVGGVSVRAAVLDQLSREAAEEGAGVEGAMSTPYVVSDGGDGGMVDDSEAVQAPVAVKKALGGGRSGNDVGSAEPRGAPAGAAVSLLAAGQVLDAGLAEGDIKTSACAGDSATGASGDPGGMTTSSTPSRPVLSSEAASTAASGMGGSMDSGGTCSMDVGGTGGDRDGAAAPAAGSGSRCDCVLRAGDADVQRHRAHLSRAYARSVRRVTGDAVWQPLEWRGMLRLAVSGSGVAGEAPAQVLWSDVTDVEGMSGVQLAVAYVSLSSELWAVRLGRAWETRFRGWNVLFFVGVFSAALLAGRNLAGPVSRCMLRDDEGVEYFDFCPEE